MEKKWKFMYSLEDCDYIYDEYCEGDDLPFLPHVGDVLWTSDGSEQLLDEMVKKCWRDSRCEDCPFIYGPKESEDDVTAVDYKFVSSIIHNADKSQILIHLSRKEP